MSKQAVTAILYLLDSLHLSMRYPQGDLILAVLDGIEPQLLAEIRTHYVKATAVVLMLSASPGLTTEQDERLRRLHDDLNEAFQQADKPAQMAASQPNDNNSDCDYAVWKSSN